MAATKTRTVDTGHVESFTLPADLRIGDFLGRIAKYEARIVTFFSAGPGEESTITLSFPSAAAVVAFRELMEEEEEALKVPVDELAEEFAFLTATMILSGSAVQVNGLGSWFVSAELQRRGILGTQFDERAEDHRIPEEMEPISARSRSIAGCATISSTRLRRRDEDAIGRKQTGCGATCGCPQSGEPRPILFWRRSTTLSCITRLARKMPGPTR
jgi:hypothetical protein